MLQINDVSKRFGGLQALNGVTVTLGEENISAIMGPNGAGKSTLISVVTGVYNCTSGTVEWNDINITGLANYQISRYGILRTFQIPKVFHGVSAKGHLEIAKAAGTLSMQAKAGNENREWMYDLAYEMLQNSGFGRALSTNEPIDQVGLAYWQLKVLQVATTICCGAQLLFLDEPAGGLSQDEATELARAVRMVADHGVKVCIVEHRIGWILGLAERVVVMDQGKIIADESPDKVRCDQRVIDCYLGDIKDD